MFSSYKEVDYVSKIRKHYGRCRRFSWSRIGLWKKGLTFLFATAPNWLLPTSSIPVPFKSVSTFDAEVYEELQEEANELLKGYKERAEKVGVQNVVTVVEMGNQKSS